jgi:hypothetical protein
MLEINGTLLQGRLATGVRLLEDSATATVRIRRHRGFDAMSTTTFENSLLTLVQPAFPEVHDTAENELRMFSLVVGTILVRMVE